MITKLEVTIEIIIHATEDTKKILESFESVFRIKQEEFSSQSLTGHFENPILLVKAIIKKIMLPILFRRSYLKFLKAKLMKLLKILKIEFKIHLCIYY